MTRTPHCWYTDTADLPDLHAPLNGEASADVCVVGAGITGLAAALTLAQRGLSVLVLEARTIGFGASGRNGGHLIAGYAGTPMIGVEGLDPATKSLVMALGTEALATTQALISANRIACDLSLTGTLRVAAKPRHVAALQALGRQWEEAGVSLEYLDRSGLESALKSRAFAAGVRDPRGGHLHPLKYTLGLAQAAEQAGVVFHENTPYLGHSRKKDDLVVVRTPRGSVSARWLILAGDAFLWERQQAPGHTTLPVNTFMIATEPLDADRAQSLIPGNEAVRDTAVAPHHFRRTPDHRLLLGGIVTAATIDPFNMRYPLRAKLDEIFPGLPKDLRVTHAWGGPVSVTRNRLPHFGRLERNVLFAQGFSGQGLALAGQAGVMMAGVVGQTEDRFDAVARLPHKTFPASRHLRVPTTLAAMARLWFEETKADYEYKRAQRKG